MTQVETSIQTVAATPIAEVAPKEHEGAYTEVVPAEKALVSSQEDLDRVVQLHNDWKESVLHPRRKIQGGRANLSGATLKGFNLVGVDLSGADLSNADLSESNLSSAILNAVNLEKANLTGADLRGAKLTNARLSGADFSNALMDETLSQIVRPETAV